jgi:hypothetical protein
MRSQNVNLKTEMKNNEEELQMQVSELKALIDKLKTEAAQLSKLQSDAIRLQENLKTNYEELYQQLVGQKNATHNLHSDVSGKLDHTELAAISKQLEQLKLGFSKEINSLRKELGLAKSGKSSLVNKLIVIEKKLFSRFPRLSFFIKRNGLIAAWMLKGTLSQNLPKLRFWRKNRHIPYNLLNQYLLIQDSPLMNRDWYLSTYKDVKNHNCDPVLHYMVHGWLEMRDPGPHFNTQKYLTVNQDVRNANINPLIHYLENGKKEKRAIYDSSVFNASYLLGTEINEGHPAEDVIEGISSGGDKDQTAYSLLNYGNKLRDSKNTIKEIKKVAFIAQSEYFDLHYKNSLDDLYEVRYFPNAFHQDTAFFQPVVDFNADINIFFRGEIVPKETLLALKGINVNISSEPFPKILNDTVDYTEDSLNRFKSFLEIEEKPFDYVFHYDEVSKGFFESQGIKLSGYFPFPVSDNLKFKPSEKKWDLFFIGRTTAHRDKYFGPLKRDFNFLHINHGVSGTDLLDFITQCKISINVHAEDEISWEPRTQLSLAAGSLLISEPLSPTSLLRPGIDYIEVKNQYEMYEVCKKVLENYDKYKHIAISGQQRVRAYLSCKKNFQTLFEEILNHKFAPPAYNKNLIKLRPLELNIKYNGFKHLLTELLHEHA